MANLLDANQALLLVLDLQEKLLPAIAGRERVLRGVTKMIRAAWVLHLPIVLTEQYPKGLGPTDAAVRGLFTDEQSKPMEKLSFGCCADTPVARRLAESQRSQILVVGIETHVCVQQTVLQLLQHGYEPYVCADAVGSRDEFDYDIALLRMQQAGAVITTVESAIFELLGQAGTDQFKQMLAIIKEQTQG